MAKAVGLRPAYRASSFTGIFRPTPEIYLLTGEKVLSPRREGIQHGLGEEAFCLGARGEMLPQPVSGFANRIFQSPPMQAVCATCVWISAVCGLAPSSSWPASPGVLS
jgi:hypothetical protein